MARKGTRFPAKKRSIWQVEERPTDLGNDAALTLSPIYGLAEIVRLLLNAGTDPSAEFPVPGVMKLLPAYSGKGVAPQT